MQYRDSDTRGPGFSVTVVQLIDGYIGQVQFEYEIVHQTELVDSADEAREAARVATIKAVKGLFS